MEEAAIPPLEADRFAPLIGHIACLPLDDPEENAAVVNALQRRSDVILHLVDRVLA